MLDDLRNSTLDNDEVYDRRSDDEFFAVSEAPKKEGRFLGMTSVERMLLAVFFFMNVLIIGFALLVATERIVF